MMIKQPVVVIGVGQLGGVFSRGFLKAGYPVYPVVRGMDMVVVEKNIPEPCFVLVSVAENEFEDTLSKVPDPWQDRLGFLQNELLPENWEKQHIKNPTVMPVWFEKKKRSGVCVFQPTPVFGPYGHLIQEALGAIDIPCQPLSDEKELIKALVIKNTYVFTINICGLVFSGTVGELWHAHPELVKEVFGDVVHIQEVLTGVTFDHDDIFTAITDASKMVPDQKCKGRVAGDRLDRLLARATQKKMHTPVLTRIKNALIITD